MVGVQKSRIAVVALFAHDNSAPFPEEKKNQKEFSRMDSSSKMPVTKRAFLAGFVPPRRIEDSQKRAEKGGATNMDIQIQMRVKIFYLTFLSCTHVGNRGEWVACCTWKKILCPKVISTWKLDVFCTWKVDNVCCMWKGEKVYFPLLHGNFAIYFYVEFSTSCLYIDVFPSQQKHRIFSITSLRGIFAILLLNVILLHHVNIRRYLYI